MKLGSPQPLTREAVVHDYSLWNEAGRTSTPTARILAGLYTVLYQRRYRLSPISPLADDFQEFRTLLRFLSDDPSLAPYVLEATFSLKDFQVNAGVFGNERILGKWHLIERAHALRGRKHGVGEQAEFRSDRREFGSVRV